MLSKRTPIVLSLALLVFTVACVRAASSTDSTINEDEEPESELPEHVTPTDEELGEGVVEGLEGDDEGFDAALGQTALAAVDPAVNPAIHPGDDVAQRGDALGAARGASIAGEAKRIAGYTKRSTSYYSHTTYINESTGTRRVDCSGLVGYILGRTSEAGLALIKPGYIRPSARDYYNYFITRPTSASTVQSARWRRIVRAMDLEPGDLLVWKYASGTTASGHVMVVKDYPRWGRRGEVLLGVVDSARSGHTNDTRGSSYSGPGAGTLGVKVDSTGRPIGYYWRGGQSTILNRVSIALARLE